MIKDRLVLEILDHSLRQGLLKEQDLDLDKAIRLCRAAETVKTQAKELFSESCNVDAVRSNAHRAVKKKSAAHDTGKNRNRCTETNEERNVINVALNILPEDVWHMVRSATVAIK